MERKPIHTMVSAFLTSERYIDEDDINKGKPVALRYHDMGDTFTVACGRYSEITLHLDDINAEALAEMLWQIITDRKQGKEKEALNAGFKLDALTKG